MSTANCAALVLAGGQSARMGADNKALAELCGRPMLSHVLARLQGQVATLALGVAPGQQGLDTFGLPLIEDHARRYRGPLAGLQAGLAWAAGLTGIEWLLLSPCDGPFVPRDLAARLYAEAQARACGLAVACYAGQLQPTFSLWHLGHAPAIERALARGQGGLMQVLRGLPHAVVSWPAAQPEPFFNVNSPADLARAAAWLDPERPHA